MSVAKPILKQKLQNGEFFFAPGVQDMIAATIARQYAFDAVYASGYWLTASAYGLPDAGIATYTQMLDRVATLVKSSGDTAVIADADTGYGGLLNMHHTVRGYEEAGVTAIQIEDQVFPKKCGHTPNRRAVPASEMVAKIRVAVDARRDPNFLIIARTDSLDSEGFESALERAELYGEAGADLVFVEAMKTREQMQEACKRLSKPVVANMADGGNTPILPTSELAEIGFAAAIFPAMSSLVAAAAMDRAYSDMKTSGYASPDDVPRYDFKKFSSLIGFEEVWAFERKWADAETPKDK